METDQGSTSCKLSLEKVTVDNQDLQISREAALRLTLGSSPATAIPRPRLIEIWVDGSCKASWDVEHHLKAHPFYEEYMRRITGPTSTSPYARYIQLSLPATTESGDPPQLNVGGDLQPVRLYFLNSHGLHTAIRWFQDAGFQYQERQSAALNGSQESSSKSRTSTPQGYMSPLPSDMNPVALSREQQHRRRTVAPPPVSQRRATTMHRPKSVSRPSSQTMDSQLQVFGRPGRGGQSLLSAYPPLAQGHTTPRDPMAVHTASHTRGGTITLVNRCTSATAGPRNIIVPRLERRSQQEDAVPHTRRLQSLAPKGSGARGSVAARDRLAPDYQPSPNSSMPLPSPLFTQPPGRHVARDWQYAAQRPASAARHKRPLSTAPGPTNPKRRAIEHAEPQPEEFPQPSRFNVDPQVISRAAALSKMVDQLLLEVETTGMDDIQGLMLFLREYEDIVERGQGSL